jgi:hypothetical protein
MDTNLFWVLRGTYDERRARLEAASRDWLEAAILDAEYNDFLRSRADFRDQDPDDNVRGHGKRLPYIGWFWRHIEFSDLTRIPIGDCGDFVGFMANNKWNYPERYMTEDEARGAIAIIDEAMRLNQQGGSLGEITDTTNTKLAELWDYVQTLAVEKSHSQTSESEPTNVARST